MRRQDGFVGEFRTCHSEGSLAADRYRLYVADEHIRAYSLDNGAPLWVVSRGLPGHSRYSLYPMEDTLHVYTDMDLYVFDVGTETEWMFRRCRK